MSNPFSKEIQKLKKEIVNEFEDEILKLTIGDDGAGGAVAGGSQDDRLDEYIDLLTELFLEKVYAGDLLLKGGFVCDKITTNQLIINRGTGLESDFGDVEIKGIPKSSIDLTGTFLSIKYFLKHHLNKDVIQKIINIGSIYGVVSPHHEIYKNQNFSSSLGYTASKSGLIGMTKWLSTKYSSEKILCNIISPSGVYNKQKKSTSRDPSKN